MQRQCKGTAARVDYTVCGRKVIAARTPIAAIAAKTLVRARRLQSTRTHGAAHAKNAKYAMERYSNFNSDRNLRARARVRDGYASAHRWFQDQNPERINLDHTAHSFLDVKSHSGYRRECTALTGQSLDLASRSL